ncbi:MAG: hypothetical protein COV52_07720 [Gammaproteobacteria bacterium CG11_big_fil_rev_8_21_14_0_20_46_22]|nr:MAG: hypothetical protein COW05_03800 [Gammaproteobacteria bacterium CG12_big_fil_rev_8_21_14_0_65_46_12]PIR10645.1 MAG: hypothetical protein COV52_07720 [Gammaproteobacteria bacterium CG11_big_fil_rev_8_21_14_0_20_46_22]
MPSTLFPKGKDFKKTLEQQMAQGMQTLIDAANNGDPSAAFWLFQIYADGFDENYNFIEEPPFSWAKKVMQQDYVQSKYYFDLALKLKSEHAKYEYFRFLVEGRPELGVQCDANQAGTIFDELLESVTDRELRINVLRQKLISIKDSNNFSDESDADSSGESSCSAFFDFSSGVAEQGEPGTLDDSAQESADIPSKPNDSLLLSLYHEMAELGDSEVGTEIAKFYYNGCFDTIPVRVEPDINKAIHFLECVLRGGDAEAAITLSQIFLNEDYCSLQSFDAQLIRIDVCVAKAVSALELGMRTGESKHDQANCALKLAEVYRTQVNSGPVWVRREKMLDVYHFAAKEGSPGAIAQLGLLYLTGDEELGISKNLRQAAIVFKRLHKTDGFALFQIAYKVALHAAYTPEVMQVYLYVMFNQFNFGHDSVSFIADIYHLLSTGTPVTYSGKTSSWHVPCNSDLAEEWGTLKKKIETDCYDASEFGCISTDLTIEESKLRDFLRENKQFVASLIERTYEHFGFCCDSGQFFTNIPQAGHRRISMSSAPGVLFDSGRADGLMDDGLSYKASAPSAS